MHNPRRTLDISILLPSRNRPDNLLRLFTSILNTTSDTRSIEVLVYLDDDDVTTREEIFSDFEFVQFTRGPRLWISIAHNILFSKSNGQILMAASDDFIFRTKNWDLEVRKEFSKFQSNPLLLFGNDLGKHAGKLPTHFFLNRVWPEKLGYWVPVQRAGLWDLWIYELAKQLEIVKYREDLVFEHAHFRHSQDARFANHVDVISRQMIQDQNLVRPIRTYNLLKRERMIDVLHLSFPKEDFPRPIFQYFLSRAMLLILGRKLDGVRRRRIMVHNNHEIILDITQSFVSKVSKIFRKGLGRFGI